MKRMLPLQDVAASDVINMFAMNVANDKITDSGDGDNGVVVSVLSGNFEDNPVDYKEDDFLGFAGGPHLGFNQYPEVQLKVKAAADTDSPIGITLLETANKDENEEKFLRYPQKQNDLYVVRSGQAVPIAKKGLMTFTYRAFGVGTDKSYVPAPGSRLIQSASAGRMTGISESDYRASTTGAGFKPSLGKVIATGTAISLNGANDYYSGGATAYYTATCLINID